MKVRSEIDTTGISDIEDWLLALMLPITILSPVAHCMRRAVLSR